MLRRGISILFDLIADGSGLFVPQGAYRVGEPCFVVVLSQGEIPTTDLYLKDRLENRFGDRVRYVDTLKVDPSSLPLNDGTLFVLVRHTPLRWLRWLKYQQANLAGVAYLMDDDIPAALCAPELPFRYALKTAWRYALARRLLGKTCSEIWVSTPELARRYADSAPKLWEPVYVPQPSTEQVGPVYFYHGTWAHRREMAWLVPVVREVQKTVPAAWFEIMGTDKVRRLFRGIPRVRVVHPMLWPDYLAYAGSVRYHVGLAPCFDTHFNRARSHCKLFDITRLGAAGIYSDVSPYAQKIIHGETGLLCANAQDVWVAAITSLLKEHSQRDNIHQHALRWCRQAAL